MRGQTARERYDAARGASPNGKGHVPLGRVLSTVEAERVEWLWDGRIPYGKITILDGDPGNGKSILAADLAARLSLGRDFPDGQPCEAASSIIANYEDGEGDTIRPRLDAAGGDPAKVVLLATVPHENDPDHERHLTIPDDLAILEANIDEFGARLVIVDPLTAALSENVDAHKDGDVRRALAPLARAAERTGAAVLLIRHLNKSPGGKALYRGGGSIAIIGAARSGLVVGEHPEHDGLRVLAGSKHNLAPPPVSLAYRIAPAANGSARIEYEGETETGADALLHGPTDPEERSARREAMAFLRDELEGGPMAARSVRKRAKEGEIAPRTLDRAKADLGAVSVKEGDGSWTWHLPGKATRRPT